MMPNNVKMKDGDFPFISVFILLLAAAKLFAHADLTWLEVFYPIIIPLAAVGLFFVFIFLGVKFPIFLGQKLDMMFKYISRKFKGQ
jgi:hypothetical protein